MHFDQLIQFFIIVMKFGKYTLDIKQLSYRQIDFMESTFLLHMVIIE